jgi:predicted transcriptional regulator
MATMTLSVPDELKTKMEEVEVINWSSVARKAFLQQLKYMEELNKVKEIIETAKFKTKESKELFDQLVNGLEDIRLGKLQDWEEVKKRNKL